MNSSMEKSETVQACEFQDNLKILREIGFFSQFPMETLKVLAYLCTRETFKTGEYLFKQHDDDASAFYIAEGSTELLRENDDESLFIRDFSSGEFVGSLALVARLRRLFSMRAKEPVTCLVITREKFTLTIDQFPDLLPKLTQNLVDGIHAWEEKQFSIHSDHCETFREITGVTLI